MRQIGIAFVLCIAIALTFAGCAKRETAVNDDVAGNATTTDTTLVTVYYFHRTIRCPSCEKIELLTKMSVDERFGYELSVGEMLWRTVNIDEPQNKHFEDAYRLQTQSVVVSETSGGKEIRWKNLDKVWDLLGDEATFMHYIQEETAALLQEK